MAIKHMVHRVISSEVNSDTDFGMPDMQYVEYTVFLTVAQERNLQRYWGLWLYGPTEEECAIQDILNT